MSSTKKNSRSSFSTHSLTSKSKITLPTQYSGTGLQNAWVDYCSKHNTQQISRKKSTMIESKAPEKRS